MSGSEETGSGGPVLVIDDDDDVREAITELLLQEGLPAVGAATGSEAEAAAAAGPPSLVLLDFRLATEDAEQVAARLRACCGEKVRIVLMTADANPAPAARRVGAIATLPKPFEMEELLRCVGRHRLS